MFANADFSLKKKQKRMHEAALDKNTVLRTRGFSESERYLS